MTSEQIAVLSGNLWRPNLLQKVWDYHASKLGSERELLPKG
ncbi:hypothetical protein QN219_17760 [Sinorhizobium sp. 7-81]|nr:hypothetical protein [Sinorhizobium sp. 8-89]MDK1491889.1 hypothetical protein [Sinorhizobium sp. 8-89]